MKKYILLVDDNKSVREALMWSMQDRGYVVYEASNGLEALNVIEKNSYPTLILLDIMMPLMDGLEFRKHQKTDSVLKNIPTIILSAQQNLNIQLEQHELFFSKPFNLESLMSAIEKIYIK